MATPRYRVADGAQFYDNWKMHYGKGHKEAPAEWTPESAEVEYDGLPGDNLIPLNAEAKARAKEAAKIVAPLPALSDAEREELQTLRDRRELETLRELDKLRAMKAA